MSSSTSRSSEAGDGAFFLRVVSAKEKPGKQIAIFGSSELASTLLRADLIDEIRIFLNPLLLGAGGAQFKGVKERTPVKLLKTETLKSGVVVLYYQPQKT